MQSYPINLAAGAAQTYSVSARRFVYESGKTAQEGGDARIIVKPDNGGEVALRPGQSFGLAPNEIASNWYVRAAGDGAITGSVIIGSGEFEDNSLKVDATSGAIVVRPEGGFKIMNDSTERVPVSLNLAQRLPVALAPETEQAIKEYPIVSYTESRVAKRPAQAVPVALFTAAENIRGVIIEQYNTVGTTNNALIAKATAPTAINDGDIIAAHTDTMNPNQWRRIKISAGKGLWAWGPSATNSDSSVLITIL